MASDRQAASGTACLTYNRVGTSRFGRFGQMSWWIQNIPRATARPRRPPASPRSTSARTAFGWSWPRCCPRAATACSTKSARTPGSPRRSWPPANSIRRRRRSHDHGAAPLSIDRHRLRRRPHLGHRHQRGPRRREWPRVLPARSQRARPRRRSHLVGRRSPAGVLERAAGVRRLGPRGGRGRHRRRQHGNRPRLERPGRPDLYDAARRGPRRREVRRHRHLDRRNNSSKLRKYVDRVLKRDVGKPPFVPEHVLRHGRHVHGAGVDDHGPRRPGRPADVGLPRHRRADSPPGDRPRATHARQAQESRRPQSGPRRHHRLGSRDHRTHHEPFARQRRAGPHARRPRRPAAWKWCRPRSAAARSRCRPKPAPPRSNSSPRVAASICRTPSKSPRSPARSGSSSPRRSTCGPSDRELIEAAALVANVGYLINFEGHHKHSYHLILNSELPGFEREQLRMLALVARYHRGSRPKKKHDDFRALGDEDRRRVSAAAAILRLALALDRTHQQQVQDVRAQVAERLCRDHRRRPRRRRRRPVGRPIESQTLRKGVRPRGRLLRQRWIGPARSARTASRPAHRSTRARPIRTTTRSTRPATRSARAEGFA